MTTLFCEKGRVYVLNEPKWVELGYGLIVIRKAADGVSRLTAMDDRRGVACLDDVIRRHAYMENDVNSNRALVLRAVRQGDDGPFETFAVRLRSPEAAEKFERVFRQESERSTVERLDTGNLIVDMADDGAGDRSGDAGDGGGGGGGDSFMASIGDSAVTVATDAVGEPSPSVANSASWIFVGPMDRSGSNAAAALEQDDVDADNDLHEAHRESVAAASAARHVDVAKMSTPGVDVVDALSHFRSPRLTGYEDSAALRSSSDAKRGLLKYQYIYGTGFLTAGGAPLNAELLSELSLKPGECVLDLGCGIGGPAFQMAELYKVAVLGIDSSTDLVSEANRSLEVQKVGTSVTFACGDVTTAALARDSFDVLFSRDLLQHVKNKAEVADCLFRCLKPSGRFLISDFCRGPGITSEFLEYIEVNDLSILEPRELAAVFTNAGFDGVTVQDRTHQYVTVLEGELQRLRTTGKKFAQEFSAVELKELEMRWEEKLKLARANVGKWVVVVGRKQSVQSPVAASAELAASAVGTAVGAGGAVAPPPAGGSVDAPAAPAKAGSGTYGSGYGSGYGSTYGAPASRRHASFDGGAGGGGAGSAVGTAVGTAVGADSVVGSGVGDSAPADSDRASGVSVGATARGGDDVAAAHPAAAGDGSWKWLAGGAVVAAVAAALVLSRRSSTVSARR